MAKTFLGGIPWRRPIPPALIETPCRPDRLLLSLSEKEEPLLREGARVEVGTLLAAGGLHVPALFSPCGGTVAAIEEREDGKRIHITVEPSEKKETLSPATGSLGDLSSEELLLLLHGAGLPMPPSTARLPQRMIVDVGGGPDNASRLSLTRRHPKEVILGAKILMKYFGVRECRLAVPASQRRIANRLQRCLPARSSMQKIVLVKDKYPQSEEHLLVSTLCNVEVHPTRSTSALGYPVVTPLLCLAAYRALVDGTPLTEVPVTLTKGNEATVRFVPLGTPLSDLPALLGLPLRENEELLHAEAILGRPVAPDEVVTVTTEALRILPKKKKKGKTLACIGCRRCAAVCPTHLMPMELYRQIRRGERPDTLDACLLCGCCSAVCPSVLPPSQTFAACLRDTSNGGKADD